MRIQIRLPLCCLVLFVASGASSIVSVAKAQSSGLIEVVPQPRLVSSDNSVIRASGQGLLQEPATQLVFTPQENIRAEDAASEDMDTFDTEKSRELVSNVVTVDLSMVSIGTGELPQPTDNRFGQQTWLPDGNARGGVFQCVHWRASELQSNPLYFQDVMLERHGHRAAGCFQPLLSGVKFYSTIALYPYLRTLRKPQECVYALGHYRPGTPAPCLKQHIPYDKRAAAVETLSLAAFFWAMPL